MAMANLTDRISIPLLGLVLMAVCGCQLTEPAFGDEEYAFFDERRSDATFQAMTAAVTTRPELRRQLGIAGPLWAHELSKLARQRVARGENGAGMNFVEEALFFDSESPVANKTSVYVSALVQEEALQTAQLEAAERVEKEKRAAIWIEKAKSLAEEGRHFDAYHAVRSAQLETPWDEAILNREEEMRRPASVELLSRARGMTQTKQDLAAYATLLVAGEIDSETPGLTARLGNAAHAVAATLHAAGRRAEGREQIALAELRYNQALVIDPTRKGLSQDRNRVQASIEEKLRYTLIVGPARVAAGANRHGQVIANAYAEAVDELSRLPYLEAVTRDEWEWLRIGDKVGAHGTLRGTVMGVDSSLNEEVSFVAHTETYETTQVRYINVNAPESLLPYNPDTFNFGYGRYQGLLRRMERNRNDGNANNDIIPIYIRVPETRTTSEPVTYLTRQANARFSVAIVDRSVRTPLAEETVTGSAYATSAAGSEGASGLPSDAAVRGQAVDDLTNQLYGAVVRVASSQGNRFLLHAHQADRIGNGPAALEAHLLYARTMAAYGEPVEGRALRAIFDATGYSYGAGETDMAQAAKSDLK